MPCLVDSEETPKWNVLPPVSILPWLVWSVMMKFIVALSEPCFDMARTPRGRNSVALILNASKTPRQTQLQNHH
jgi:hypothetical protein